MPPSGGLLETVLFTVFLLGTTAVWRGDTTAESQYDKIRLPGNIRPLRYDLYIHPNLTDGRFLYCGTVEILLQVKEETDSIILHSLRVRHLLTTLVEFPAGREIIVKRTTMDEKYQQAIIQLGSKLSKDKYYVLTIHFCGELSTALNGFYKSAYTAKSGERRYLASTDFEPTGARLAFPCFDEPAMKAKFKIHIVREKIHIALSNMPIEKEVVRADGLIVDSFQESVKMSTYLVAFVVSDFASLSATSKRGIKVNVWAPKDQISQAKYAIEIAPKILDYYEKFFNVEFPLPKLDLIAIPDFSTGAMENWGLITYRLTSLLHDEKESSSANKQNVAVVIAHEMAHQWFGNLVTMKWWNDLWLNEGFASFIEYIGTNHVSPDWKMMDQFVTENVQNAMALDSHLKSHPISVAVKDPVEIGALFDTITYEKGSAVIRMLSDFIGAEHFVNGLTNYLNMYKYGNAESDDLWRELSKETVGEGINVKTVMDTWTRQMGYPVVNVRREGKEAHLTQERFVTDTKDENSSDTPSPSPTYKWNIPLTFYYQHSHDKKRKWFHVLQDTVVIPWSNYLGWLKLNVGQIGFYRVNYDKENWKALATQLNKDHEVFSSADRSNLIDDAFQLANVGKVSQVQALELTEYLTNEEDYVPFFSAKESLEYIGRMLHSRPGYAAYGKYLLQKILPRVKKLGWKDEGSQLDKYLRGILLKLAVRHNSTDAVKDAQDMFNEWMVKGKVIPANLRPVVYCAGIKYGGAKEWNFVFGKYRKCLYPSEKKLLMDALTYTSNPVLLKRYLEMTLKNDVVRAGDTCYVMMRIAWNPIGTQMAYHFIKEKWNVLIKRYREMFDDLSQLIDAVFGRRGKTKDDLERAKTFFATHDMGAARLAADQTLATIRNHMKWLEENERIVVSWMNTKV